METEQRARLGDFPGVKLTVYGAACMRLIVPVIAARVTRELQRM